MTMDEVLRRVSSVADRLRHEFDVSALYVFGSVARGDASRGSDIDVLVDFRGPPTFARFMDLKFLLEDALETPVDLVTRPALRPSMRRDIEAEAKRVA